MPLHYPIVVEVDCPEPRILLDALLVTAGGKPEREAWALEISSGVWRSPVRKWVGLSPLPVTAAWRTTTTGNYARLKKTDYTLTTAAAWKENDRDLAGNTYLEGNGTNERVRTTASYPADQPWFLSVYVPGVESLHEQTILECGWGPPGDASTISLRIRANGGIAVYKGTTPIGYNDTDYAATSSSGNAKALGLKTVNLLLLPGRILNPDGSPTPLGHLEIVSDALDGFIQQFEGLDDSDPVVPAGYFWWQVPAGRPCVQLAPCRFEVAGALYGPAQTLHYPPDDPQAFVGTAYTTRIGPASATIAATYGLVKTSDLSTYSPDGSTVGVRVAAALTGDADATLGIEAIDCECERVPTTTADDPVDITAALQEISWQLDDRGVASVTLKGRKGALETAGVEQVDVTGDRPFRIYIVKSLSPRVEIDLIRGTLSKPVIDPAGGIASEEGDLLSFTGQDRTEEFEHYMFLDAIADDGRTFIAAIERAVTRIGVDTGDLLLSSDLFAIPRNPNIAMGEWSALANRGDLLSETIDNAFDNLAANWWRGWVPTLSGYKYRAQSPSDLSSGYALELWERGEDALAHDPPLLAENVIHRTVRKLTRHPLSVEANQVIVLGQQPASRRLIVSQSNNTASQTPGTAPADRPASWRGRLKRILLVEPGAQTQGQADSVRDAVAGRTTQDRHLVDIECDFLIRATDARPLWTGDVIRIYLKGGVLWENYRIVGMPQVELLKEHTAAQVLTDGRIPMRQATYRGERIASGSL